MSFFSLAAIFCAFHDIPRLGGKRYGFNAKGSGYTVPLDRELFSRLAALVLSVRNGTWIDYLSGRVSTAAEDGRHGERHD